MNLKSIQRNYDLLSMRERFALLHAASIRQDENECSAIHAASPRLTYRVYDFHFYADKVFQLHNINLLERWNHQSTFEFFHDFEDLEDGKFEKYLNSAMLSAYLYVIETDAWKAVGDEFGFDVVSFRERLAKESLAIRQLELYDSILRKFALTEDGARKVIAQNTSKETAENIKTLESVIEQYRSILLES
jgi:hypothetical protein